MTWRPVAAGTVEAQKVW